MPAIHFLVLFADERKTDKLNKIKIKIITLGYIPFQLDEKLITRWKSSLFEITPTIEKHFIKGNSDSDDWQYSDSIIEEELPKTFEEDFLIGIVNIPLERGFYARRFKGNRICFTFHEIAEILRIENQKPENYIIRNIYRYGLVYQMYNQQIPPQFEKIKFTHDDTRRCIFDANGIKTDLIYSLERPVICEKCSENLIRHKIPVSTRQEIQKEIKKIRKAQYFRIGDFIKNHPILSIAISALFGILISVIAAFLYDYLKVGLFS